MRFEAKHSYFKQLAHSMGNFVNITYSLATRHQYYQCYLNTNPEELPGWEHNMEVGPGEILYAAKLSRGKTFAVVHKMHYSLENFRHASARGHHMLYTESDSRGKLSRSAEKPRKFFPSKVLRYTVLFSLMVSKHSISVHNLYVDNSIRAVPPCY